jgi:hypothetical protein
MLKKRLQKKLRKKRLLKKLLKKLLQKALQRRDKKSFKKSNDKKSQSNLGLLFFNNLSLANLSHGYFQRIDLIHDHADKKRLLIIYSKFLLSILFLQNGKLPNR